MLGDGLKKGEGERRLAINSTIAIQRTTESTHGLLERIEMAARTDAVASDAYYSWIEARQEPSRPTEAEREIAEIQRQNAADLEKRDQSWIDFIHKLRDDQVRVSRLRSPTSSNVNPDLIDLWQLLSGADGRSRYAIDSVAPLKPIVGNEVAEAVRDGLIEHWRNVPPLLQSQRNPDERQSIRWIPGRAGLSADRKGLP